MHLNIAFIHPDLGIGGAERLVVDAAVGLQKLGNKVSMHTSHHDPSHCFEETVDGTLRVVHYKPPFFLPRSIHGKFHIILAHLRQFHLTWHLSRQVLKSGRKNHEDSYDIFFVDQLSTCIPLLRWLVGRRVVFYCHFPDKLLAEGEFIDEDDKESLKSLKDMRRVKKGGLLKRLYRMPMDWLEEKTTGNADIILANSRFTARIFKRHFPSIHMEPDVVYPGINVKAYENLNLKSIDADARALQSDRPTFISLNRFEAKKNVALAIKAFSTFLELELAASKSSPFKNARLVIAGGYDPRLKDNIEAMESLLRLIDSLRLTYHLLPGSKPIPTSLLPQGISSPTALELAQVVVLPNFSNFQRSVLLRSPSTLALLYTPNNEHFGIGPVEGMVCGLPILACNSGGPKESVVDDGLDGSKPGSSTQHSQHTGWLRPPDVQAWAEVMCIIAHLTPEARCQISDRAKSRARSLFSMEAMALHLHSEVEKAYAMGHVTTWRESHKKAISDHFLLALGAFVILNILPAVYFTLWGWIPLLFVYGIYTMVIII